jgi:hypothetical protein
MGDVVTLYRHIPRSVGGGQQMLNSSLSASQDGEGETGLKNMIAPVRLEFLRVDGGGGIPQIALAPQDTELQMFPTDAIIAAAAAAAAAPAPADPTKSLDSAEGGFISIEPVASPPPPSTVHHPGNVTSATTRSSGLTFHDYQRPAGGDSGVWTGASGTPRQPTTAARFPAAATLLRRDDGFDDL